MKTQNFDQNGLPLSTRGTTCYKNVSYTKVHYNGLTVGYVAVAPLSESEQQIADKKTFAFHLGFFDNMLDAAYVARHFDLNREELLPKLRTVGNGCFFRDHPIEIPQFEFEAVDTEVHQARREKVGQAVLNESARSRVKTKTNQPSWVEGSYMSPVMIFSEIRESLGYTETTEATRAAYKIFKVEVLQTEDSDSAYLLANDLLSACE